MNYKFENSIFKSLNQVGQINFDSTSTQYLLNSKNEEFIIISVDGIEYQVNYKKHKDKIYLLCNGYHLEVTEIEQNYSQEVDSSKSNQDIIYPPMPGMIVNLFVEQGYKVKEGDPLIAVEAMKMETVLYSKIDGIVEQVLCEKGDRVSTDDKLIVVSKEL